VAGPNAALVDWQGAELVRLGVDVRLGTEEAPDGWTVVQCTGGRAGRREYEVGADAVIVDIADVRRGTVTLPAEGDIVVHDPIGGPIGVAIATELGGRAVLVTQDNIAGNELSRTGDLAPANVRLAQAGVRIERRSLLRRVGAGEVVVADRYTGGERVLACAALVDCGFRLPTDPWPGASAQAGDCVAPRTVHEAVLEARRAALAL
jgi:2,4-dienoyl-CoA reductase (NADPH2)